MTVASTAKAASRAGIGGELLPLLPWLLGLALVAAAYGVHRTFGPFQVIRGMVTVPGQWTPASYLCFVFLPFGVLVGDVAARARRDPASVAGPAAAVAALSVLATLRLVALIPFSGHALFAAYYLCHESDRRAATGHAGAVPWRLVAAGLLALQILYFKIHVWGDVGTLVSGTLLGLTVWSIASRWGRETP